MDKQEIAENLELSILDRVRKTLREIPTQLSKSNIDYFVNVMEKITKITTDAFPEAEQLGCRDFFSGWRRLLIPYWTMFSDDNYEIAWGYGFTWKAYFDSIIESNAISVQTDLNSNYPCVSFLDNSGKIPFKIVLDKED